MGNRTPLKILKDAMLVYSLPDDLINRVVAHMHIDYYPTNNQIKTFIRHEWSNYDDILKQDHNGRDSKRYVSLKRHIDKKVQESLDEWRTLHKNSYANWVKRNGPNRPTCSKKQLMNQSTGSSSLQELADETDDDLVFNVAIRKAHVGQSG